MPYASRSYASRDVASDSDAEDDYNRRENRPSTSREVHSARHLTDAVKASEGLANETSARLSSILHTLESTLAHYDRTGRLDRDKFVALIEHVRQSLAHAVDHGTQAAHASNLASRHESSVQRAARPAHAAELTEAHSLAQSSRSNGRSRAAYGGAYGSGPYDGAGTVHSRY
ncbi:uncharacterized protein JCM10292_007188 [Rhodotorula paludigena]|uniref:uncharacterized protein n=1 Tax=Rhodotorula paludigena TaxID=86838 RepID=UPI003178E94F